MSVQPSIGLTYEAYRALPEITAHVEFVDGHLEVWPAPTRLHQRMVLNIARALQDSVPAQYEVVVSPFDCLVRPGLVRQPDVLVIAWSAGDESPLRTAPMLAVEVLS